ncbi:MAG: GyrI-like domain-containing protein [Ferruginibacter sp.]
MEKVELKERKLAGLSLKTKTSNTNGQSTIDCENLWHEFMAQKYMDIIPGRINEIIGAYHQYEGDSSHPFSYFIGCEVKSDSTIPDGLDTLIIPAGNFMKIAAKGKMPDCVTDAWKKVWVADLPRTYQIDFEIYDERSKDWEDAQVDVYISIR